MTEQAQGFQLTEFSEKAYRSIADCDARINIWHGAVRSGKTISSLVAWGMRLADRPSRHATYMMIGKTRGTLERNCIIPMKAIWGEDAVRYSGPKAERMYFCGRRVDLVGANDEQAADKVQGSTLTDAYGDELTTWHESMFKMLMSRLSVKGSCFYGTTNPDSPGHWLKKDYLGRAAKLKLKSWHFTLDDNPALPPEYVEALKREYSGLWYRRYVLGEWTQAEGAIYDRLQDSFEMADDCDEMRIAAAHGERYFAIDYGTMNPFVCLDCYLYKDHLYVVDEWRHDGRATDHQMTDAEYATALYKFAVHPDYVTACIIDPSATSFKAELRQPDNGFSVRDGKNAVLEGIRQVSTMLGQGRIHVASKACQATIEEMRGYRWKPSSNGEEKPLKDFDHGPDALRYIIATLGLVRPIDDRDEEPYEITMF